MIVHRDRCLGCGGCAGLCPSSAIELKGGCIAIIKDKCKECGLCMVFCPVGAIEKT